MPNIPLIPGVQQTFSRFNRRGKKQTVVDEYLKETATQTRRSFKRALYDRRKRALNVRLERRSSQERRNQQQSTRSTSGNKEISSEKGRHINTTA